MGYIPYTKEQKQSYAKRFSKKEKIAYSLGVRRGFLQGIHKGLKSKEVGFIKHTFSKEELEGLYDDLDKVKLR